jgi:hypothetical protein
MNSCSMCGASIPDGQDICSMCYGDPGHGSDGYYEAQLLEERRRKEDEAHRDRQHDEYVEEMMRQEQDQESRNETP